MFDSRRYLGGFAVFSLVLLRLVIGWHFLGEGTKKVEYDRHDRVLRLAPEFSAEGFLTEAKGPLAPRFRSYAPGDFGYRDSLAVARRDEPLAADASAEQAKWASDYVKRRAEATKQGTEVPIEFPPHAAYHDWAERIRADWLAIRDRAKAVAGLNEEQKKRIDAVYAARLQELADYLAGESEAIKEYQHELWRLQNWQSADETGEVPFHDERVATKAAETRGAPTAWLNQVRQMDADYQADVRGLLTSEQRTDAAIDGAMANALTSASQNRLRMVNLSVTVLTIAVGICLLLGLLTRLAAFVGALFLLSVIATQPPWIVDAAPTMSQIIEFAGLLVLAGTGAGRWAGLDYFGYALFRRRRTAVVEVETKD